MNRLKKSSFSSFRWIVSNALMKFPFARCAMVWLSMGCTPYFRCKASAMLVSSILRILKRCVRLRIVDNIISGASDTRRNTVFSGGSSNNFNNLLAQTSCIFSGSHTIVTLYPPSLDFKLSLRVISSLSFA